MSTLTGTITVRGQDFEVRFDPESQSQFNTYVHGNWVKSKTWKGLQSAIGNELRKLDVTVDVRFVHPETALVGTAYKIHAAQRKPMIRWEGGATETSDVTAPLLPDTDTAELKRLHGEKRAATKALRDFQRAHLLGYYSLTEAVKTESARVVAEQDAATAVEGVTPVELDATS